MNLSPFRGEFSGALHQPFPGRLFFGRQVAVGTSQPQTSRKMAPGREQLRWHLGPKWTRRQFVTTVINVYLHIINILVFIYIYTVHSIHINWSIGGILTISPVNYYCK